MTPAQQSAKAAEICRLAPVVPVLVIDDLAHARPLAEALVAGGLPALEVTLRTPVALDAIRAMAEVPGGIVGAGTLLTPADVKAAKAAGATFGVSPGATDRLIAACEDEGLPLLPGAATASEIMALLEKGYTVQKFFPAEQAGGAAYLKSIGSPIPQVKFCCRARPRPWPAPLRRPVPAGPPARPGGAGSRGPSAPDARPQSSDGRGSPRRRWRSVRARHPQPARPRGSTAPSP
ncbi:MAG: bifunctional 4-hydroxy-2-oxoglutarate aldolase/2-dehydro-3-deoxy-phosphogluconate aldolase [Tabrizicola sp.]|nr:bifunctional 4-hydroxy-2-oxoglutarate aldolase/2-dehydro-3-deoxy-phosphogluconate aldolase [Tabrizicola sp.]